MLVGKSRQQLNNLNLPLVRLIRDYRLTKHIALNMENKEMLKISGDFDLLTVMQKVEVFTEALRRTTGKGNDMYEILWRYAQTKTLRQRQH